MKRRSCDGIEKNVPTLTDVLGSSSEARLPSCLLLKLIRLLLRTEGGRMIALAGRILPAPGDMGGEETIFDDQEPAMTILDSDMKTATTG